LIFLAWDFAARIYWCPWSLLGLLGDKMASVFSSPKWIDAAPKRFATRIGFLITIVALLFYILGWIHVATAIILIIGTAAAFEAFFGLCIGCWLYRFRWSSR
jgi:hypothetical protein